MLNGWLAMAAIGGALAFLMKGPVGLALPLLIVLIATRAGLVGRPRWLPVPPSALAVAAVLFVLVAAPWFVAMAREHGVSYLHRFFVAENVERFATDRSTSRARRCSTSQSSSEGWRRGLHFCCCGFQTCQGYPGTTHDGAAPGPDDGHLGGSALHLLLTLGRQTAAIHPAHPATTGHSPG